MSQKNNFTFLLYAFPFIIITLLKIEINASELKTEDGITPYFQARLWAGYTKYSRESAPGAAGESHGEYTHDLPITGSANLGLTGDINNVRGRVELGFNPENSEERANQPDSNGVYLRHLYASYKFGHFNIIFGRTWTFYTYLYSKNVADDEGSYRDAGTYDGRLPQVSISMFKYFNIGLIKPYKEDLTWYNLGSETGPLYIPGDNLHFVLPKLAAGITIPMGQLAINLHLVYQKFTIEKGTGSADKVLNTALTGLDGKTITGIMVPVSFKFSIASFSINFNGYWGKNIGTMGIKSFNDTAPDIQGNNIRDNTSMGGRFDFSFDAVICLINFGHSYEVSSIDLKKTKDDISFSYYANLMFYLEKNLYIAPAWWRVNKKSGWTKDKYGLKFQANF